MGFFTFFTDKSDFLMNASHFCTQINKIVNQRILFSIFYISKIIAGNVTRILQNIVHDFYFLQTLRPTDPPIFEVTNVLINETATQLALWGRLGIAIMELPKRWGKDAVYEGGKKEILCM